MANLPQSGVSLVAQNAGQFVSTMAGAEGALGSFGKGAGAMSEIVTGAFRRVGELVVDMAGQAARAVGDWLKDSVGVAGDFEQTLNVLGATSGATAADLDQVAKKAKELGADMSLPATSAQDAAEVMLELSKAGFSVQESMDAAKGALQLSAAAQVDAATAASITAGAINAFGLEASDAVRIADLLAAGANASSASMTDLSAGLQQAGFAFNAAGLPVEDLVTSLAALTNVGLTGSDAGTALKNALMRLMNPTDKAAGLMQTLGFNAFDAQGKMKPFPTIIADLNKALAGMTDEQRNSALGTIFLSDGMKAMIPLLDLGTDGFFKLKDAVTEQGAAATVANAQMQGWNGGIQAAGSQMETLQLIVGTFIKDALTPLLFWVAETAGKVTTFADAMFSSGDPLAFLIAKVNEILPGFSGMVDAIGRVVNALGIGLPSSGDVAQGILESIRNTLVNTVIPAITQAANWLANNLPGAISTASGFFNNTLIPALSTVWTWLQSNILPILANLATAIGETIPPYIQILAGYWNNVLLPALNVIWSFIADVLLPIISDLAQWLAVNLPPTVQKIADFLNTVFFPALNKIFAFIQDHIIPILADVAQWLRDNVPPAVQKLSDFFTNTLLPAITDVWNFFDKNVLPVLKSVANVADAVLGLAIRTLAKDWNEKLKPALDAVWGVFKTNIIPILESVAKTISDTVGPPIHDFIGWIGEVTGGLDGIKRAIDSVVKFLNDMATAIRNMPSLPDVFTPGSPTPAETGFWGVAGAIGAMNAAMGDIRLGRMDALKDYIPTMGALPALPIQQASANTTTVNNSRTTNMPIYTNQSPSVLSQGLALVEAITT